MDLIFYLTVALFILLFGTLDNNIDFDFWARLVVGKSFFQTGTLFANDFQSYGTTHEFIDHEWFSSIIFYLVQHIGGDIGIYLFKSLVIFLTIFIITKIIRLENKTIGLNFLFFFFALQSISYNIFSTIRCQTFSFFFFALYIYILQYSKIKNCKRILWTLPVLNIIWTNLHGGFTVGLILIFIYALGEFLNKKSLKEATPYIITFFLSLLTTLINPYGIKYIYFIVSALLLNRIHITEWQSAFFSKQYTYALLKYKLFFYPVILLFIYSVLKHIKLDGFKNYCNKIDKTKYLILLFTLIISLKSIRFHVFFTYAVIMFCYCDFYKIFNKKLPNVLEYVKNSILLFLIAISSISHLLDFKFINTVKPSQYPIYCTEFIKLNKIKGNVFTNFHTGSYVSYKLFPENQIFMDGRYEEVYDNQLINEMSGFFLAVNYKNFLKKYHTDILIIDKTYPVYEELKKDKTRFLVYESNNFALFLPSFMKQKKYKLPPENEDYYNKTKFKTDINWF